MTRNVRPWMLAAAAAAGLTPGLTAADPPPVREYRDLKPSIDTVETIRLLSADKAAAVEEQVEAAYKKLAPSVVRLWVTDKDGRAFDDKGSPRGGAMSGVIVGADGLVLTCAHHGMPPKTAVVVELADGRRANGVTLGRFDFGAAGAEHPDLGLARITDKGDWPAAAVGPAELPAGGTVGLAIGYPGTLPPKNPPQLRLGRVLPPAPGYPWVQSTTGYVGGDSGGPLFDLAGRVLGVVNGGDSFAGTHYEPVAAFLRHRDALAAGEVVSAPRPGVRVRRSRLADFAAFVPALDLQDAVGDATVGLTVRVLDGATPVAAGTLVDPAGWVVTKRSLVDGRSDLHCLMSSTQTGRVKVRAKLVAGDPEHDLALLRVEAGAGPQPDKLAWADGPPAVGRLVAPRVPGVPLRFAVVGSGVRAEDPPAGDVAQLPIHIEPNADGKMVVGESPYPSGEYEALPELARPGDVITHLAGTPTPTADEFGKALNKLLYAAPPSGKPLDSSKAAPGNRAGEPVEVTVLRDGKEVRLRLTRVHSAVGSPPLWWNGVVGPLSLRRDGFPAVFAHDGGVRPEDCGGPVVDLRGRVVGVTIARADATRTLAVPADVVRKVVADLRKRAGE